MVNTLLCSMKYGSMKYGIRNMHNVIRMFDILYIYICTYVKFTETSHHNTLNMTQNRWM